MTFQNFIHITLIGNSYYYLKTKNNNILIKISIIVDNTFKRFYIGTYQNNT